MLVSFSKLVVRSINEDVKKEGKQKDHHTVRFPPPTSQPVITVLLQKRLAHIPK